MIRHQSWRGLASNVGTLAVPPGAMLEQTNLGCFAPGKIQGRRGLRKLAWYTPSGSEDIVSMTRFQVPGRQWVVYEKTDGSLKAIRDSAALSLASGLNPGQPMSWARDRRGLLYATNGLERGKVWDGYSSGAYLLGITAPAAKPTISNSGPNGFAQVPRELAITTALVVDDADNTRVRAADITFTASLIGYRLQITSGTGFNTGIFIIEAVEGGDALLSSAAGSTGSTGGGATLFYQPEYSFAYRYRDAFELVSNLSEPEVSSNGGNTWTGGHLWTLVASSETRVRFLDLYRSTPEQDAVFWKVASLANNGTVSTAANAGGKARFTVPAGHGVVVGQKILMSGNSEATYNATHLVTAVGTTTIDSSVNYASAGGSATWVANGYEETAVDDEDLVELDELPILNADDSLNARQHDVPPTHKPFVAIHQDTGFYYGVNEYATGTVAISGTAVTGTSTAFTSAMAGWYLYVQGGSQGYKVASYGSATGLTLESPGPSVSGVAYVLRPEPIESRYLYYSQPDLPESVPAINAIGVQDNVFEQDRETGLMGYGSYLWLLHERNIYRMAWAVTPADGIITHSGYRGCFNNRSHRVCEGVAYLMDQFGCYRLAGVSPEPIGNDAIQDLFRDGTVDLSKSSTFHTSYEPNEKVVRFWVVFAADSSTAPKRAICYSTVNGAWWLEKYPHEVRDSTHVASGGRMIQVLGATDDRVLYPNGTTDFVDAIQGTATAGGASTLTDSGATFGGSSELVGAPVAIIHGTGAGQIRVIASHTGTVLTVDSAWTTQPSTDSIYLVGAVELALRTGAYSYEEELSKGDRAITLAFTPTATDTYLQLDQYDNLSALAANWLNEQDLAGGRRGHSIVLSRTTPYVRFKWDTATRGYKPLEHWTAHRFFGFQGASRVELHDITVEGLVG